MTNIFEQYNLVKIFTRKHVKNFSVGRLGYGKHTKQKDGLILQPTDYRLVQSYYDFEADKIKSHVTQQV